MIKKLVLLISIMVNILSVYGQSYLGTITNKTSLFLIPNPNSTNLKTLEPGTRIFINSLKLDNNHYNVIDIETNYEGFVPKHLVKLGPVVQLNKNGIFTEAGKSSSSAPEANIFNNTPLKMTIKIDQTNYVFNPGEKKKITLKTGTLSYRASAPGVMPSIGSELFKSNRLYTWEFYINSNKKK